MTRRKSPKVGVLIARFQAEELHPGWIKIIEHVRKRHKKMLLGLGDHGGMRTKDNPLTFEERERMFRQKYPQKSITVARVYDNPFSSKHWSKNLDKLFAKTYPGEDAVLYGSRKSFIPKYSGRFPTVSVSRKGNHSGTRLRNGATMPTTEEGRAGAIYAVTDRPDLVYSTVDIIIHDAELDRVLLITKDHFEGKWAFPGGFADPSGPTDLHDAKRERKEEVRRVRLGRYTNIGRIKVKDPRYRDSSDGIRTAVFVTRYVAGKPVAGDDAKSVKWFPRSELKKVLVPWHKPQARIFDKYLRS